MHIRFYIRILFGSILLLISFISSGQQTLVIDTNTPYIEGTVAPFNTLKGGDTIKITAGNYPYLLIRNLTGSPGSPIVLINHNGMVIINTDHHYGISMENCKFVRLTGTGYLSEFYGIRIERVKGGGGLGANRNCSDIEIDHLYISDVPIGGLYAKTDPDCSFTNTREKFTQFNTRIHDNYIANVGNEGLYIGNTKYFGQVVKCNGKDTLLMPPLLDGVYIYNNILNVTGWDGIQVSSASSNCSIYNNLIMYDSEAESFGQMSGIIIGGGSRCDCYNNFISNGKGNGIESHGLGGYRIFNNIIVNAGKRYKPQDTLQMKYGIYITDVTTLEDSSFSILFNDIISPKSDGIRFSSTRSHGSKIFSNAIIDPGNFDYYERGGFTFKGIDSFIMIPNDSSDVDLRNNYFTRMIGDAGFNGKEYTLAPGSPLIDGAHTDLMGIGSDFYGHPRIYNGKADIGAHEYNPEFLHADHGDGMEILRPVVTPNPARSYIFMEVVTSSAQTAEVCIIDLQGHLKVRNRYPLPGPGKHKIRINLEELPAGTYLYRLQHGDKVFTGKIIKLQ